MGVAKNHQFGTLLREYAFESGKIHDICVALRRWYERVFHHYPAVAFGYHAEGVVNGRLYDNFVAGSREKVDSVGDSPHYAGHKCEFFFFNTDSVTAHEP